MHGERQTGFTILELVVVLVLVSILSAYAGLHWTSSADATVGYQADRLSRDLRHVQALAMNWGQALRIAVSPGSYSVVCVYGTGVGPCVNAGDVVRDPATGKPYTVLLDYGVAISGSDITFDTMGRPVSGGVLQSTNQILTLSGGSRSWSVTTQAVSGFVDVAGS